MAKKTWGVVLLIIGVLILVPALVWLFMVLAAINAAKKANGGTLPDQGDVTTFTTAPAIGGIIIGGIFILIGLALIFLPDKQNEVKAKTS